MSKAHISGLLSDLSDSFSFSLYLSLSFFVRFCFCPTFFFLVNLRSFFIKQSSLEFKSFSCTILDQTKFFRRLERFDEKGEKRISHLPENHPSADFNITRTHTHTLSLSLRREETRNTPATTLSDDGSVLLLVVLRINNTLKKW